MYVWEYKKPTGDMSTKGMSGTLKMEDVEKSQQEGVYFYLVFLK